MVARRHRQQIGADLIGGIAVGGDAVGTNDHPAHATLLHQMRGGALHHDGYRNPFLHQFPGGEASALQPRPGFIGVDAIDLSRCVSGADHAQGGAVTAGGEGAGIAMGQHRTWPGDELGTEFAHAAIGGDILCVNALRLGQQCWRRIINILPGPASLTPSLSRRERESRKRLDYLAHAGDGPEQIDRGGTRCGEMLQVCFNVLFPGGGR